jgi:hypothetical protein
MQGRVPTNLREILDFGGFLSKLEVVSVKLLPGCLHFHAVVVEICCTFLLELFLHKRYSSM